MARSRAARADDDRVIARHGTEIADPMFGGIECDPEAGQDLRDTMSRLVSRGRS